ncbi:Pimeloyl-ACP methyl ester carboxylesterase [Actinokineospora alba]|uniref:Pimeloyl-ACP methyl ester carboxylesterase n=1 Tax=Actinokineospora alba TaxID=504798 RepID=A0A1H0M695_9PSEU|nr:alpha/beta hydrolase [Actinokineospora alba]TDP67605.1 pimeloyl-ACP methyl ester carboxylesterase [Actinokineospora alba]SDI44638.1 Pimeloyl-ACP methyl ester carboxylesterase [Actinokineospora alba]SDO76032.1 Pimeloyl-ACP methyl ester carboxylesterase [Actinokineospora alba]
MTRSAANRPKVTDTVVRTDDGAELAVTDESPVSGHSPAVVLVHGWGAARPVWRAVAADLVAAGHRVISYDQRGHGKSTLGAQPIGIARLGADLGAVLGAVDLHGAVVVGHSGGGFAAMSYVTAMRADARARVRGLVLLSTAAHDRDIPNSEVKMMGNAVFSWALRRPPIGRAMLRQTFGAKKPAPPTAEANRRMFAGTDRTVRADYFRASRGMDLRDDLRTVPIPAVVLAGDADKMIRPDLGEAVAAALPEATFRTEPGVGHMFPLEAPAAVVSAVAEVIAH